MHAELSGKLRAARKALQDEQAALEKEREAHSCTLIAQEALVEEVARYTTNEATETSRRYIQGQKDRIESARAASNRVPPRFDAEDGTHVTLEMGKRTGTAHAKRKIGDTTEVKSERKRIATGLPSWAGPVSGLGAPTIIRASHQGSEILSKRSEASFGQTQGQPTLPDGSGIARLDGFDGGERPLKCIGRRTQSPESLSASMSPFYGLRHQRPNDRYIAFTASTPRPFEGVQDKGRHSHG